MAHYLVTGGAGFIGSHVVRRLVGAGHQVRVIDNLSTGRMDKLADVVSDVDFHQADLRNGEHCRAACRGIDMVFHQAALPSVPRSVEQPDLFHANNVDGTFKLLMAARDAGCRRVIYAGSSSVYGDQPELPKHEGMRPAPLSPYALNKLVGEYYCSVFTHSYGLETVTLRYFNVFGAHQDPAGDYAAVIPAFVSALLKDRSPVIYGDGEQTRDFTHIDNVVEANLLAAQAERAEGQAINVACGQRVTINEVVTEVGRLLGKDIAPTHAAPREGDVMHSSADIRLAAATIGYRPQVTLTEGLSRTIEWYKDNL